MQNADLWQALLEQSRTHEVSWHWVRGHSGHEENKRADALAVAAESLTSEARLGGGCGCPLPNPSALPAHQVS